MKKNVIANYIGQGYATVIGILVLPLYLRHLSAEAFGLVGFFVVMQSWLQLLDMGLSPTFAREVARMRGGTRDFAGLWRLLHSLEIIYLILALVTSLGFVVGRDWIAHNWLKIEGLDYANVVHCLTLMGIMVGFRWFASLYLGGIKGMECQVWLNGAIAVIATLRFAGSLALLHWVSRDLSVFFEYQLVVGMAELLVMGLKFYSILPGEGSRFGFSWEAVKGILPFASAIAYTAGIWILLTQLDKLLLSHLLLLKEYGYFALVTLVANGILQVSTPVSQAILPKMTCLLTSGDEQQMLALYRKATQFVALVVFSLTGVVAMFASELLYAWTGDKAAATWAGPILFWYALGNGLLAMDAFQYYLQYAHGKLKLHAVYYTVVGIISVPIIIFASRNYGALGAAMAWFGLRAVCFFVWPPIVHHQFASGIHRKWLLQDILPFFATTAILLVFLNMVKIPFNSLDRFGVVFALLGIGFVLLMCNVLVSRFLRDVLAANVLNIGKQKI